MKSSGGCFLVLSFWASFLAASSAEASVGDCSTYRAVLAGRVPDVIFPVGHASCVHVPNQQIRFRAINDSSVGNCGLVPQVIGGGSHVMIRGGVPGFPIDCNPMNFSPAPGEISEGADDPWFGIYTSQEDLWIYSDGTAGSYDIEWFSHAGLEGHGGPDYPIGHSSVFVKSNAFDNAFTHVVTAANQVQNGHTVMSSPLLNNNPTAIVVLTAVWNYNGNPGVYNNHPISAVYNIDVAGQWSIINADGGAFLVGAQFNVEIEATADHAVAPRSNFGDYFDTGIQTMSYNWEALLFPTSNNPGYAHTPGVWFNYPNDWYIFNEDGSLMGPGASYFVESIGAPDPSRYVFRTQNWTLPQDGDTWPDSYIFIAPNYNYPGYVASPLGVWWDGSEWAIFRQDYGSPTTLVEYNVFKHVPAIVGY